MKTFFCTDIAEMTIESKNFEENLSGATVFWNVISHKKLF